MLRIGFPIFLFAFALSAHAIPNVTCTMSLTQTSDAQTAALSHSNPYFVVHSHGYSDATVLVSTYPATANLSGFVLSADMIAQNNHYVVRLNLSNGKLETGTQFYLANSDEPIIVTDDYTVITLEVGDDTATVRCRQYSF